MTPPNGAHIPPKRKAGSKGLPAPSSRAGIPPHSPDPTHVLGEGGALGSGPSFARTTVGNAHQRQVSRKEWQNRRVAHRSHAMRLAICSLPLFLVFAVSASAQKAKPKAAKEEGPFSWVAPMNAETAKKITAAHGEACDVQEPVHGHRRRLLHLPAAGL